MKTIYTIFPWLPGAPAPTHIDHANYQLEEARIRLLEEEKAKERAMANCEGLKARIRRLEAYVRDNASQKQQ